jgi:hypothetical protein
VVSEARRGRGAARDGAAGGQGVEHAAVALVGADRAEDHVGTVVEEAFDRTGHVAVERFVAHEQVDRCAVHPARVVDVGDRQLECRLLGGRELGEQPGCGPQVAEHEPGLTVAGRSGGRGLAPSAGSVVATVVGALVPVVSSVSPSSPLQAASTMARVSGAAIQARWVRRRSMGGLLASVKGTGAPYAWCRPCGLARIG